MLGASGRTQKASPIHEVASATVPSKTPKEEMKPEVPGVGSVVGNLEGVINVMAQTFSEISEHNRLQVEQQKIVIDKLSSSDAKLRSTIKYTTPVEFPKGCKSDLENLDRWFREFERVVQHLTSGSGNMLYAERISHLLASWPATSPAGKSLDSEVTSIGVALRNK